MFFWVWGEEPSDKTLHLSQSPALPCIWSTCLQALLFSFLSVPNFVFFEPYIPFEANTYGNRYDVKGKGLGRVVGRYGGDEERGNESHDQAGQMDHQPRETDASGS